jgi:sugar phosphate isomerase/epimerase
MNAATEWTVDEKFSRVAAHGFQHVEYWPTPEGEAEVFAALKRHNLAFVMGHHPYTVEDTKKAVDKAVENQALYLFAQPCNPYTPLEEVADIVRTGREYAESFGLPYFVETHRNNYTETIPYTLALMDAVPEMRITGDFSHFVVVGEFYGWKDERAIDRMRPILERTVHLHARIGNGEQVQVDVGDGTGMTAQFFVSIWETAMRAWLKDAGPGDIFPVASELGPPRYAITLPDGSEFSDRWEQSLVMKRLMEQAWSQAQA